MDSYGIRNMVISVEMFFFKYARSVHKIKAAIY